MDYDEAVAAAKNKERLIVTAQIEGAPNTGRVLAKGPAYMDEDGVTVCIRCDPDAGGGIARLARRIRACVEYLHLRKSRR